MSGRGKSETSSGSGGGWGSLFGMGSKEPTLEKTSTLDAFLGKFSNDQRKDLGELYGVNWEEDDAATTCRSCFVGFSFSVRKHHCRNCGGIYCENCCREERKKDKSEGRICNLCKRGEAPGDTIKQFSRQYYKPNESMPVQAATYSLLKRGTDFPEEEGVGTVTPVVLRPPISGYFEIVNKAENEFFGIKVVLPGLSLSSSNVIYESARPPYIAIPPLEYTNCRFNPEINHIDVYILFHNTAAIPADRKVVYDTSEAGKFGGEISACASISKFSSCVVFRIACKGCNVLLKYKGGGVVECRRGDSIARVGVFSRIFGGGGGKSEKSILDYNTNVHTIDMLYNTENVTK